MQSKPGFRFNTIVVATDLTESTSSVFRYAQEIARLHKSKLVVVHVIDPVSYAFPGGAPEFVIRDQSARAELRKIEDETRRQGIQLHSVVQTGVIYERILQTVKDHNADLLVIGTRAKTELGRLAIGTVARQLLSRTPCPLLAVSPDAGAHLAWAGRWRHVVAAVDFSGASLAALEFAHRIAHEQLIALHVMPTQDQHDCSKNECSRSVEQLRFLAPFNESNTVPVEHVVAHGSTPEIIAQQAQRIDSDLIVLGAPGKELAAEDFPASTVLRVISQTSAPVLCVPAARQNGPQLVFAEAA